MTQEQKNALLSMMDQITKKYDSLSVTDQEELKKNLYLLFKKAISQDKNKSLDQESGVTVRILGLEKILGSSTQQKNNPADSAADSIDATGPPENQQQNNTNQNFNF